MTLEEALASRRVRIEFTKINGELRSMLCTKDLGSIPADRLPKSRDDRPNSTLLKVYDLENQGWRSMKVENILSWAAVD